MNELFDKLIIRVLFTFLICGLLYVYKYTHFILYPSARFQILKKFNPYKNPADTIHYFARILGICIVFSNFSIDLTHGLLLSIINLIIQSLIVFVLYVLSLYLIESIVLYNFEYKDEVLKKKNLCFSALGLSQSLALAYIVKKIIPHAKESFIVLVFLWLLSLVLLGFATKTYSRLSKLSFNKLLIRSDISLAISYTGFIWGWVIVISSALSNGHSEIKWYLVQIILKVLLALMIYPIFHFGVSLIFSISPATKKDLKQLEKSSSPESYLSIGVYEGSLFLACSYLTTLITNNIHFGMFYPIS